MVIVNGNGIGDPNSNPGQSCVSLCINVPGKGINPSAEATSPKEKKKKRKKNEFKPAFLHLKIELMSYSAESGGISKCILS